VATSVAVLVLAGLLPAPTALAADPVTTARQDLSRRTGSAPSDFQLVGETRVSAEAGMWAGKFLDARTGAVHSSYRRADGKTGSVELLDEALAIDDAELQLKRSYVPKLEKVLPISKVARYLQIEHKVRTAAKYEMARLIPLVE